MGHLLNILLLLLMAIALAGAVQPCYYSWNTTIAQSPDFVLPCYNTTNAFVSCCAYNPNNLYDPGNYCLSHNLCLANGNPGAFYLSPCTDPDYADPSCPRYCQNRINNNELRVTYNPQISKWQCCATDDCTVVTDEDFDAPAPWDLIVTGPADVALPTWLFPSVLMTSTVGGSTPTTPDSASSTVSTSTHRVSDLTPPDSAASGTGPEFQALTSTSSSSTTRAPTYSSSTSSLTESSSFSNTPSNIGNGSSSFSSTPSNIGNGNSNSSSSSTNSTNSTNSSSSDGNSSRIKIGVLVGVPVGLAVTGWLIAILIAIFSRDRDMKEKAKALATFGAAGRWSQTGHQTQKNRDSGGANVGPAMVGSDHNIGTGVGQHQAVIINFQHKYRHSPRRAKNNEYELSDWGSSATSATSATRQTRKPRRGRPYRPEAKRQRSESSYPGTSSRGWDSSRDELSDDQSADNVVRRPAQPQCSSGNRVSDSSS